MTREELSRRLALPVSRETYENLQTYERLLLKWQERLNLVASSTVSSLWERHILDSLQLLKYIPKDTETLCDLGTGAGFPGLVLAIASDLEVTLIESDRKKCAFLQTVSRETKRPVLLLNERIENVVPPHPYDIITARALAPLEHLLLWAEPLSRPKSLFLFLKGKTLDEEIEAVRLKDTYFFQKYPSLTDCHGHILEVKRKSP